MNKTAIKNFAIWARNKLIADVSYRAGLLGITDKEIKPPLPQSTKTMQFFDIGTAEPYSITGGAIRQRERLADAIEQKAKADGYAIAYQNMIEEVAYTWFNRLIAIRFMEVNDYMPAHIRVLSSDSGKMEPDIVTTPFDAELEFTSDEQQRVMQFKTDNKIDELFRMLFIKQCNALNSYLPALFEKTNDYSELLLNLSVIDQEGVVYHLIHDIDEADFNIEMGGQVEIIGWLYQYYNTEPKAAAFAQKEKIRKDQIPAVTQLFTPDWIVRYMVENSLGRLWVEGHPDHENLKSNWKYYLEEAEQELEVQAQLAEIRKEYAGLNPEDIRVIDPCMGSGHILVYCFDLLLEIYEAAGYSQRDAARSILENNIYGLDIDDRAFQLSYFALMMKARQYNRRILSADTICHVHSICESNEVNKNQLKYFGADLDPIEKNNALNQMQGLIALLHDAKEYGSILNVDNYDWDLLRRFVASEDSRAQMSFDTYGIEQTQKSLVKMIEVGENLSQKYHVVITNPPYMGSDGMGEKLSKYVKKYYPESRSDMYAVFIQRCTNMLRKEGFQAMITQHTWMFLSSFEKLRREIISEVFFINMAHLGARAFEEISGEVVQTVAWIMKKGQMNYRGVYKRLVEPTTQEGKKELFLQDKCYLYKQNDFKSIPGYPIAYWISSEMRRLFVEGDKITEHVSSRDGLTTGNNDMFIRYFWEIPYGNIEFDCNNAEEFWKSEKKFAPLIKGGLYRKWYGNNWFVITYDEDGYSKLSKCGNKLPSRESYFLPYISWNRISTRMAFKYCENGYLFESASLIAFANNRRELMYTLAYTNSVLAKKQMELINPTTNMLSGYVDSLCIPMLNEENKEKCIKLAEECVELCRLDWNSTETSWDYKKHPLVERKSMKQIEAAFCDWRDACDDRYEKLKQNEEEINRIFTLQSKITDIEPIQLSEKDITVRKADRKRDIVGFISYAVGCMLGRYSLDSDGIVTESITTNYSKVTFEVDSDNCIPITDEQYLEDDIVERFVQFVKTVYGERNLEENLDYISNALGNKGDTSRDIIRNYFLNDFYADHLKIYQKKPIYWMFDSGKQNGFKCLIYLHRYTEDAIGNIRVDYLHRMQKVYESECNRMQEIVDNGINSREVSQSVKRKEKLLKQLKECRDYDELLGHIALARTRLDFNDGVKVNYEKLQTAPNGKKYAILAKI